MQRQLLFVVLAVVAICAAATDRFYIEDFVINPGETVTVSILLDNETEYTAFQADICMPGGLTIEQGDGEFIFDLTNRKSRDHNIASQLMENGSIRIMSYSPSIKTYSGNSGALVSFSVTASADFTGPLTIELKNILFTTTSGAEISFDDCVCKVTKKVLTGEIIINRVDDYEDGYGKYLYISYSGSEDVTFSILCNEHDIINGDEWYSDCANWNEEMNCYVISLMSVIGLAGQYGGDLFFSITVSAEGYPDLTKEYFTTYYLGGEIGGDGPRITTSTTDLGVIINIYYYYSIHDSYCDHHWIQFNTYDYDYDRYGVERLDHDYYIIVKAAHRTPGMGEDNYSITTDTILVPARECGISITVDDENDPGDRFVRINTIGCDDAAISSISINDYTINLGDYSYYDSYSLNLLDYEDEYGRDFFIEVTVSDRFFSFTTDTIIPYYVPIPAPIISISLTDDEIVIDVVTELSEKKLKLDGVEVDELPYSMPRLDHDYYATIQAGCSPDGERWAWSEEEIILIPAKIAVSTLLGDVNSDNLVNISDITALIDYLLSGNDSAISLTNADCNGNGAVNIADVVELIDYLLAGHWPEPELTPVITTFTANGVTFDMVEVEGGTFMMGGTPEQGDEVREREKPVHQVTLSSYNIGQTEVTQELWLAVMGENPSYHTGDLQRPVERVSWVDCQEFISKLNQLTGKSFRLPTEAEWEYAARGGNKSKGYRYAGSNDMNEVSWYIDNSSNTTHPVGTKAPNELSLYDMTGNVWEWTNDWFKLYTADPQVNPTGPATGNNRVLRGGCWNGDASYNRIAYRDNFTPTGNNSSGGLRLVLDVDNNSKFSLSETVVKVQVGWTNSVFILNGGGNYTVAGGTDYATASINGNKLIVTGTALGTTTVCVTDAATGATAVLTVIVTESTLHEEEFTVNGVTFKMITIDGGTFTMGATEEQGSEYYGNERPTHQVRLSSYRIGQTEVTQKLWQAVMGSNPSNCTGDLQRPVEKVSWNDCQTFITRLNQLTGKSFRLPTEAEWEFASRGGNLSQGYKFAGSNTLDDVAWFYDNSDNTTHPVGTKTPNELGLYDMSGNVFEWCQDWFGDYSGVAQINPTGPTTGTYRVVRGGAWNYSAKYCRLSYRSYHSMTSTYDRIGLRLALD